ncbi:tetratricopeptide repeat protein [Myxococcota bacterium]|nr:tetratricopeptide repeat protein [Myxococcota bacterium]
MGRVRWCPGLIFGLLIACSTSEPSRPPAEPVSAAVVPPPASTASPAPPSAAGTSAPRPDWPALRASEADCEDCHPDEVNAWRASAMGRSLLSYTDGPALRRGVERPRAERTHPKTGQRFAVALDAGGRPVFSEPSALGAAKRVAAYLIGSGAHTRSYLWSEGDALFEAPLTWYPQRRLWDLSPGYGIVDHPGMYREIKPDCLFCHADPAPWVEGSLNRYRSPAPGPIGCSRCHGDARAHVRARLAGGATDDPVMPSRLAPARREDVCNQCHYAGAVRLAREGRAFGDYLPPARLADTVAIFRREGGETRGFGIASHAERLAASRCGHGALGCTDCHAPHAVHGPGVAQPDRSSPCRACHGETHNRCAGPAGPDCVRCHMRVAPTSDIPHVAMTDHRIRRHLPHDEPESAPAPSTEALVWIARPADVDDRDPENQLLVARAYAEAARGGGPRADADRRQALALLPKALEVSPGSAEGWADLASMHQLAGDRAAAERALERSFSLRPADVRIARAVATARITRGDGPGALSAIDAGLTLEPQSAPLHLARASAAMLAGRRDDAVRSLDRAMALRPGDAEVLLARAVHEELSSAWAAASDTLDAAAVAAPQNVQVQLARVRHAVRRADWSAASTALRAAEAAVLDRGTVPEGLRQRLDAARALVDAGRGQDAAAASRAVALLTRGVRDPAAAHAMGLVSLRAGQPEAAVRFLEQAVTWGPEDGAAWSALARALERMKRPDLAERARSQARRFGAEPSAE